MRSHSQASWMSVVRNRGFPALADIPQIGFGPSLILLPFGSFGKVESSSLAKDGALFICQAVPSLKNADFPIIKTHLSLSFHSNASQPNALRRRGIRRRPQFRDQPQDVSE